MNLTKKKRRRKPYDGNRESRCEGDLEPLKIIALICGLILAFIAIWLTIYLSNIPNALNANAVLLFVIVIVAVPDLLW